MSARRVVTVGLGAAVGGGAMSLLARGALTLDLGIGRTLRPLGPLTVQVRADRSVVFDVLSEPYLGRTPRALASKLRVLERGQDMVLAEHFTQVGGLVATTLETVRFDRPARIHFRLVRGPVPYVVEEFALEETSAGTELTYSGRLGTDLWALGRWWGERVARRWESVVQASLEATKAEAERRTRSR